MADEQTQATEGTTQTAAAEQSGSERTFTQAEVDEIVRKRVARVKATVPDDYGELKEKAARLDQLEEASKSERQRVTERAEALKKELDGIKAEQQRQQLVASVAKEMGVDAELLAMTSGTTEDDVRKAAEVIKAKFGAVPGYQPDPHDEGGSHREPPRHEIPVIF